MYTPLQAKDEGEQVHVQGGGGGGGGGRGEIEEKEEGGDLSEAGKKEGQLSTKEIACEFLGRFSKMLKNVE